jgi:hypothetical protein
MQQPYPQCSMTHSQRDLYQNQSKQKTDRNPLNLIGGKFYQGGEKKKQNIWETERRGKEKKSRWSNIKNTFFTHIGTQPIRRRNGRNSPHRSQDLPPPHFGSSPSIAPSSDGAAPASPAGSYHDPSDSYLRLCPSYHDTQMFYDQRYQDQDHHHDSSPRRHILSPSYDHLSAPPCHSSSPNLSDQALYNTHNTTTPSGYQYHNQYYQY